ncbi:MAG: Abortive infection protein, partial [Proteobacteria bacterium]|nr:Abortive infection protein [Pseudomonadota bacterium]
APCGWVLRDPVGRELVVEIGQPHAVAMVARCLGSAVRSNLRPDDAHRGTCMRSTALFFLFLLACMLLAAALTPPLLQTGWLAFEPHRVMSRLAQLLMMLGVWPFLRLLGLDGREALGYGRPRPEILRALVRGWLAGVAILVVLVIALLALEIRVPDLRAAARHAELARKAAQALAAGLLIGVIEETFFRGALFTAIRRRGAAAGAILWPAVLYAAVHFLKPGALADGQTLDWPGTSTRSSPWSWSASFSAWSVSAPGTSAGASAFTRAGCS